MDDLALIFSHHKTTTTSRKRLHEDDEKADANLACLISFSNSQQYSAISNINHQIETFLIPKAEPNTISFSQINENINIGAQFGGRRTGEQAQEHLLAERKRRQKITKLFVSLASLLPGLNKMDKASILEGATTLITQLRERAETMQHHHLEAKTNNEKKETPPVKARNYEHESSIDMMSTLPEVEVRSLEDELLITIYCKKQQTAGNIDEILSVIHKLHLTIKSSNFIPFGSTAMHITVVAQMNNKFCETTTNYLADRLRQSILKM
ncbi:transcription factor bHLH18-like [Lycium ferocissimum]|uniref:transcription factor bHLH18-like n=1 Tax=Lycium ferocissimum TaxID=112874 RepID=UPI00281507B2|nr:transcription factor bHLH18-like [Lycium ferocissimum]